MAAARRSAHRRLRREKKKRVERLSDNKIGKMRRAAREAVLSLMPDPTFNDDDRSEFATAIREAFGFINDQTFRSRMADLLSDARKAMPEIAAAFAVSPDDSQILTLFYKGEQSLEEIGRIMGLEPNTVKVKLHRARNRLKEKMEKHFSYAVQELRED